MTTDARGVTPYRKSHWRFDLTENTVAEAPFNFSRTAGEIARGHTAKERSTYWHFLAPDAIVCKPWQDDISNLHERTPPDGVILGEGDYDTVPGVVFKPTFKAPTDLPGVIVDALVQATGDYFAHKTVPAGESWAQTMGPDIDAYGQVPYGGNVSLDRIAVGKTEHPANTAFLIRLLVPAASPHNRDVLGAVYFGGPRIINTVGKPSGIYAIVFDGSGQAFLDIYKFDGAGGGSFETIDAWQAFSRAGSQQAIQCRVWPHYTADGRPVIQVVTDTSDSSPSVGTLVQSYFAGHTSATNRLCYVPLFVGPSSTRPSGSSAPSFTSPVTGPGPVRVDVRRDLRLPFQVSVLAHVHAATIYDDPFSIDWFPTRTVGISIGWRAFTPDGTSVDGRLYDYDTDTELTQTDSGTGYRTYQLNAGKHTYYAKFVLTPTADYLTGPVFYGYRVIRDGVFRVTAPGEWKIPDTYPLASIRDWSVSGPDKDFTHETATAKFDDPAANLGKLNVRAGHRSRLEIEYDPADAAFRSVLFDGYAARADARLKGYVAKQGFGGTSDVVFPSAAWREFAVTFNGVWQRLRENLAMQRLDLGAGVNGQVDATGIQLPYKVTDVCRALLSWCGFASGQIDVPDSPIRFFPGSDGGGNETTVEPLTEIGSLVEGFLRDYLGWFLVWDGNAGSVGQGGMIRAIPPTPFGGPYTALAKFTLDLPSVGRLGTRPESYGSVGWYATGTGDDVVIPITFIRKRTYQTHVKPPEANAVHVTSTGEVLPNKNGQYLHNQWAWNPKSFDFFTDSGGNLKVTSDPTNPDYLGRFVPLVVVNTALSSQFSVDVLTRRLYDSACRAQKWAMFDAPLVLVRNGSDSKQVNLRPLRYYDPVKVISGGVETTWIVRSCNPYLIRGKDAFQMAHYELMAAPSSS